MTAITHKLRHRIMFERQSAVQDPVTGEMTEGWQLLWQNVPASIEPLSGKDFIAAGANQNQVTARIVIRFREGVRPDMRIRHAGLVYEIHGVLPDAQSGREYLTLMVSGGMSDG